MCWVKRRGWKDGGRGVERHVRADRCKGLGTWTD